MKLISHKEQLSQPDEPPEKEEEVNPPLPGQGKEEETQICLKSLELASSDFLLGC